MQRAGFFVDRQRESYVILVHEDTDDTVAVPYHGSQDLAPGTLRSILRDAGLAVEEFRRLLK